MFWGGANLSQIKPTNNENFEKWLEINNEI